MRRVLLGSKRRMVPIPWFLSTWILRRGARKTKKALGGLDDEHRRVHHFVVKELPRLARPMPPDFIADRLKLDKQRVIQILDELERRLSHVGPKRLFGTYRARRSLRFHPLPGQRLTHLRNRTAVEPNETDPGCKRPAAPAASDSDGPTLPPCLPVRTPRHLWTELRPRQIIVHLVAMVTI
jgi:hypothetical protein